MSGELASLSSVTLELDKVAPFLIKLFEIVSSPASDYLICWSEMGDSFRIIDRTKFAQVKPSRRHYSHPRHARRARAAAPTRRPPVCLARVIDAGRATAVLQARQPTLVHPAAEHLRVPASSERLRVRARRLLPLRTPPRPDVCSSPWASGWRGW